MRGISTTKLLILAILGFCALILGSAVLTLQIYVTREKQRLGLLGRNLAMGGGGGGGGGRSRTDVQSSGRTGITTGTTTTTSLFGTTRTTTSSNILNPSQPITTTRPSRPISSKDIHMQEQHSIPPQGRSPHTVAGAYWRQAAAFLQDWDALLEPAVGDDADGNPTSDQIPPLLLTSTPAAAKLKINPQFALQQAANAGHPMAQHYVANAHASGIWPVPTITMNSNTTSGNSNSNDNEDHLLHVFDEWSPTAHGDHPQLSKAFLLWHMAAIGGNIESAMALAHRISELAEANAAATENNNKKNKKNHADSGNDDENGGCADVLPYLEAAAHGIMDELEASPHSRAKVLPPMDKHILAHVHIHGGTSSQLDWNNKPHESKEAIQFYHLKATTTPWSARFYSSQNKEGDESSASASEEATIDIHAAYTLAHLYHYGLRGVPQNLTQSLLYYEIAGSHGHWESAGEAGTFYLWGMGTVQNVERALQYFQIGAPFGWEGCRRRHEQTIALKEATVTANDISSTCDATSLNGLGVLHLLGVPGGQIEVDMVLAEKYFALAKEMGNADAMYNLSMMWLGWKTHFKHVHELTDDGVSIDPEEVFPASTNSAGAASHNNNNNKANHHKKKTPSTFALHYSKRTKSLHKGPTQSEIQDAIKVLSLASAKGHLQAKHRLAMIYAEGVQIQTAAMKYDAVKPSCTKARALYQWITEHASLQRSRRLRKAYRAYMEGDLEVSLRNYLAAAETGSNVGQVNAAFLLERGICLGLSAADCAKASVRLWKAASARGNAEACLRVGDFYYYGRLRGNSLPVGPFGWVQYLLYPEEYLPQLLSRWTTSFWNKIQTYLPDVIDADSAPSEKEKGAEANKPTVDEIKHQQELLESDLSTAAYYYTEAVEKYYSPRANFNLGFMYEWGLGLKQDFPLAKRHYDLAASVDSQGKKEAELAVQIALWAMRAHEYVVKLQASWDDWPLMSRGRTSTKSPPSSPSSSSERGVLPPKASQNTNGGQPVPGTANDLIEKTAQDVILSHIFNWSSLAIAVLLYIVVQLRKLREYRRRR